MDKKEETRQAHKEAIKFFALDLGSLAVSFILAAIVLSGLGYLLLRSTLSYEANQLEKIHAIDFQNARQLEKISLDDLKNEHFNADYYFINTDSYEYIQVDFYSPDTDGVGLELTRSEKIQDPESDNWKYQYSPVLVQISPDRSGLYVIYEPYSGDFTIVICLAALVVMMVVSMSAASKVNKAVKKRYSL